MNGWDIGSISEA